MIRPLLMIFAIAAVASSTPVTAAQNSLAVTTTYGPVYGFQYSSSVRAFLGIPFARPPVGEYRWTNPEAPAAWTEPYNATYQRASCYQPCIPALGNCGLQLSEDCLYLDIYTPSDLQPGEQLPVFFWIYGGAFIFGSIAQQQYRGSTFASMRAVYVAAQYRVGPLGFLVTGSGSGARDASGNYGIKDQRFALQWVQANIAAFGGDKSQVAIVGESAGAMSTAIHHTSPGSWMYFSGVIQESNPFAVQYRSLKAAAVLGNTVAEKLSCPNPASDSASGMTCLRSASPQALLAASDSVMEWSLLLPGNMKYLLLVDPVVDGDYVVADPIQQYTKGVFKNVSVIIGTNLNESVLFISAIFKTQSVSWEEYYAIISAIFGVENALKVSLHYGTCSSGISCYLKLSEVLTDYVFRCPSLAALTAIRSFAVTKPVPHAYSYLFAQLPGANQSTGACADCVCHSAEVVYVFNASNLNGKALAPTQQTLADLMSTYWARFVRFGGDVNQGAGLQWNDFTLQTKMQMQFNGSTSAMQDAQYAKCAFWDSTRLYPTLDATDVWQTAVSSTVNSATNGTHSILHAALFLFAFFLLGP
eukprot:ANDGO_00260.mRNA.1 Crystal protein